MKRKGKNKCQRMDQAGNGYYKAAILEGVDERLWEGTTSTALLCVLLVLPDISRISIGAKGLCEGIANSGSWCDALVTAQLEVRFLRYWA
jgi:hypothetical protein